MAWLNYTTIATCKKVACKEYLQGLELLSLTTDKIPELTKISAGLMSL